MQIPPDSSSGTFKIVTGVLVYAKDDCGLTNLLKQAMKNQQLANKSYEAMLRNLKRDYLSRRLLVVLEAIYFSPSLSLITPICQHF